MITEKQGEAISRIQCAPLRNSPKHFIWAGTSAAEFHLDSQNLRLPDPQPALEDFEDDGQQHLRENADDGDDDEPLDQGKAFHSCCPSV